jgi:hypothetical protein
VRTYIKKKQKGLSEEIKGKKYRNELGPIEDLERLGVRDLHIVVDRRGLAGWREMSGEQHRVAVEDVIDHFHERKDGRAIKGQKEANVFVSRSFNIPKRCASREI